MPSPVTTDTSTRGLSPARTGKVRDIYDLDDRLLVVATDRLSAFDVVLPDGIPGKGEVLTRISAFWFQRLRDIVPNHLISIDLTKFPGEFRSRPEIFTGRSMLVKKTKPLPVECVVRGYLSGSGWNDYVKSGNVCGIPLPKGLRESEKLPVPLFTPSTKAEQGLHDENISFDDVVRLLGKDVASRVRDLTLRLYQHGSEYAATRGIIIADTKFEFGIEERGEVVWIDEALTPDSSRFWPSNAYAPGGPQPSFDKQFVRDFLISVKWNKQPPAPSLPADVIRTTARKYAEALELLTGEHLV